MKAKKLIALFSGLAVLLGLILLLTPQAKAEDDFYPGTIYYEQDGVIIENILAAGLKNEVAEGTLPALSPNGKYLVYYNNNNYPVLINTVKHTKKTFNDLECSPVNQPVWSPNGKYFTIESHTSTSNTETIVNKKGETVTSFETVGDFSWWNSKNIIYTALISPEELNSSAPYRPRGDGGGDWYGIAKLILKNNQELSTTVLMIPDEFTDYQLFDIKNKKIRFTKTVVAEYDDWRDEEDQTHTYWKMSKNGKHVISINQPKSWEEKISEDLVDAYADYLINDYGGSAGNHWRLFTLREDYDADAVIYVMYLTSPETMFEVDDGESPTW